MEWQSMDTAPKTGDIQLYCDDSKEQFVGFWNPAHEVFQIARAKDGLVIGIRPSHWKPLGEPPNAPREQREASDATGS